jgi:IS30 family transposase
MTRPGPEPVALATNAWLRQAVASKLRSNWAPEQIAGWLKRAFLKTSGITCRTRRSIAVYLFKPEGCSRKSCFAIFGRSAQSVDRNRRV